MDDVARNAPGGVCGVGVEITILGWEKINGRKDVKNPSWFKFMHKFFEDSEFYEFSHAEIVCWIYFLCEASKKNAAGKFLLSIQHANHIGRIEKTILDSTIKKLQRIKVISFRSLRARDASGTYACTREEKIREEERREEKNRLDPRTADVTDFDFESVYRRYPRKLGKSKGIKKLKSEIRFQEDFEKLIVAVENYSASRRNQDPQYTKHFSTFVSEWRDWIEFTPDASPAPTHNNPAYRRMAGNAAALEQALASIGEDDEQAG